MRRQFGNAIDEREPRPHRPFGVVLMGLGIPEVDERTIAHVFGNKATIFADEIADACMVDLQQFLHIFRVKAGR